MKTKRILKYIFFVSVLMLGTARAYTISGYVVDAESGETIIGVNVMIEGLYRGSATDGNGYFRITNMENGDYTLKISHIAYQENRMKVIIANRSRILKDIPLKPHTVEMDEIVVLGEKTEVTDPRIEASHLEMTPKAIRSIPGSGNDVFRAIKHLPGIQGTDPFSPLFSARGSDPGENLVLLDGVTIYNPYHFVSSSGLFNVYAIKNIEMLVGGFGAEFGGRNSSILYITTREGNNKEIHGELEPSTSRTNFVVDFPISQNATMMISGRIYYDLVSRFLFYMPSNFYDTNISLNWKLSARNRLSLRYFYSRDVFDYSFARIASYWGTTLDTDIYDDFDMFMRNIWNNQAFTAILKTVVNPNIYLQTQISGSFFSASNYSAIDFEYVTDDLQNEKISLFYSTDIQNEIFDLSGKIKASVKLNSWNTLNLGDEFSLYSFENDFLINDFSEGQSTRKPNLTVGFVEDVLNFGWLVLRPGLRYSKFSFHQSAYSEPRMNGVLHLPKDFRIKAAWGRYFQYIVSMNSQEYEISQYLDYYYPLKGSAPSASTHYLLGFEKGLTSNSSLSLDFYYKDIVRTYTFDSNLSQSEAFHFSDKLKQGTGESYGVELLWRGTWREFSGWASYGLSRSTRSYPHILNGKEFLFDYDRTHAFKAVLNHQVHPALSYSGTLQVMSGVPKTLERALMSYYFYDPLLNDYSYYPVYIADRKNNIRLPFIIQLDLGLKKRIRQGFGAELAEFLGAKESYLNVTFGNLWFLRRNVWFYIPLGEEKFYGIGTNYFPAISMGYTIKF